MEDGFYQRFNVPVRVLELAQELRRGVKNLTDIQKQIAADDRRILQYAVPEDLKVVFQGCSMLMLGGQVEDAICQSVVSSMLAEQLIDKNLNFGLEVGVGHTMICALFVQSVLSLHANLDREHIQLLDRMAPLLKKEKDSKGYLEILSEIGQAHANAKNYSKSVQALREAIRFIDEGNISRDVLAEDSNQDMVRATVLLDYPRPITALGEVEVIKFNLHSRAAQALIALHEPNEAVGHTSEAIRILKSAKLSIQPPPELTLNLLHIHGIALLGSGQFGEARDAASDLLDRAKRQGSLRHEGAAASILALSHKALGEEAEAQRYLAQAEDVIRALEKEKEA